MTKILILAPYPLHEAPSQRFRFELFLKFMEQNTVKWDFQSFVLAHEWKILYQKGQRTGKLKGLLLGYFRRLRMIASARSYDMVLIHREITPLGPPIFEWVLAKVLRKKIIYDFDDAIWMADQKESLMWKWLKWRSKVRSICKWSWKVSAGNEYLADYARKYCEQVEIIPTVVDTDVHTPDTPLDPPSRGVSGVCIGWTGSHSTLFYLDELVPTLQKLEKEFDFEFLVIANKNPHLPLNNFRFVPWNKNTEIADLNQIDIGIMPLQDNEWAKGKCGFKLIQYLALGIPAVASPVGVNAAIIQDGENGLLANTPEVWKAKLSQLIQDTDLRRKLGENGRKQIVKKYSVESLKSQFFDLFI